VKHHLTILKLVFFLMMTYCFNLVYSTFYHFIIYRWEDFRKVILAFLITNDFQMFGYILRLELNVISILIF